MLINAASFMLLSAVQAAPAPSYWGDLRPGTYPVGFSQRWVVDSTRRLPGDIVGLPFRPILLNLWYPASRTSGERMQYGEYFEGATRAAGADTALAAYARALVAYSREVAWRELAGAEPDSTPPVLRQRITDLFNTRSPAYREAPASTGVLPVIVYTQGAQSSLDDNVVLCEYLASRGYLVIGSAFPREDNSGFATSASDESRPRDIRRLLLEAARMSGVRLGPVTVVGHSAGAQAMQRFAADPSAPIDAVLSLDTTEDYAMLSDRTWAYYTDPLMEHRRDVRMPLMFVAGPEALFELADSLTSSARWLVTVPYLRHNEFISQGIIRQQLRAGLPDDDPTRRERASRAYSTLLQFVSAWLDSLRGSSIAASPADLGVLGVATVDPGQNAPRFDSPNPRTARELRHLFSTTDPAEFANTAVRTRAARLPAASDPVLMMLLVHAVRQGEAARARAVYGALVRQDSTAGRVRELIEARAILFERIQDPDLAREWRGFLSALDATPGETMEGSTGDELMSQAEQDRRVDYIEFLATNMEDTKRFYSGVFGWEFTDYGPDYTSFTDGRLAGGFSLAPEVTAGGPLIVLYATNLAEIEARVGESGGRIVRETFEFPGGRRFHFTDPSGNELAVWSDR